MMENIVEVEQGLLKGGIFKNVYGNEFISFMGVPYAEPPLRKLRFKDARPLQSWMGIRDATKESNMCPQISATEKFIGDEDCLQLNIVTSCLSGKKAVLVWIHGGGFTTSGNTFEMHSPDYLVSKDVVFVGVNYRLGILGFLNMDHKDCPGNQGLKDQVMALRWIQKNIEVFGGDPENVTIMGGSAGSACVHYLCLSPLAKGLFQKAILQSGVATNPWAFKRENKQCGYELAEGLGEDCDSDEEVIEFLRTISPQRMSETWEKLHPNYMYYFQFSFCPTIDNKSATPFMTDEPSALVTQGIDVPVLMGYNSHEGIICFLIDQTRLIKRYNDNFEKTLISELKLSNKTEVSKIAADIRKMYFGSDAITAKKIHAIVQLQSDVRFVNGIQQVSEIQRKTKNHPIYFYKFSFSPNYTLKKMFHVKVPGTAHTEELACLFYSPILSSGKKFAKDSKDYEMAERISTMWTNFAKTGDPNSKNDDMDPTWVPMTKDRKNYIELGEKIITGIDPDEAKWKLWRSLYLK